MPTNGGHPPEEKVGAHQETVGTYRKTVGTYRKTVGTCREIVGAYRDRRYSAGTPISFSSSGAG